MRIQVGPLRLVSSSRVGRYDVQHQHVISKGKNKGETRWKTISYSLSLSQALERMLDCWPATREHGDHEIADLDELRLSVLEFKAALATLLSFPQLEIDLHVHN